MRLKQNCTGGAYRPSRRQYRGFEVESAAPSALATTLTRALILRGRGIALTGEVGSMSSKASSALVNELGVHRANVSLALTPSERHGKRKRQHD